MSQKSDGNLDKSLISFIKQIINEHSSISNAVNALSQKLPFSQQICYNIITELVNKNNNITLIDDTKLNDINDKQHQHKYNENISIRAADDSKELRETYNNNFHMNWTYICNAIQHEMWPKLANAVRAIINNEDETKHKKIDLNDLSQQCIDNVINILRNDRYLALEERQYLRSLIKRATTFNSISETHHNKVEQLSASSNDFHFKKKGLNQ
eukprot:432054_1